MNDLVLRDIFAKSVEKLPLLVGQSIRDYRDKNCIAYRIEFNDSILRTLEQTDNCRINVAVNVLRASTSIQPKWLFIFREYLTSAPKEVIDTIVQHELIHCFLKPFFFPEPKLKPAMPVAFVKVSPQHHQEIDEIIADTARTPASLLAREEELVAKLNLEWGCDEISAREWLQNWHQRT